MTIHFGKRTGDYRPHFDYLMDKLGKSTWKDFIENFPGNTSDFSDAIRNAFSNSLKECAIRDYDHVMDDDDVAQFLRFCEIHFLRSLRRVTSNRKVIEVDDVSAFTSRINGLKKI